MTNRKRPSTLSIERMLRQLRNVPGRDPAAAKSGRAKFTAQIKALPAFDKGRTALDDVVRPRRFAWLRLAGLRSAATLVLVALLLGSTGLAYASQNALPHDPLFPLKRTLEDIRLVLSNEDANDAQLLLGFTQRRVSEMTSLVAKERYSDLSISANLYTDQLLQIVSIIVEYKEAGDPRGDELLSALIASLFNHEKELSTLLGASPELEGTEIESTVRITQAIASEQSSETAPTVSNAVFRGTVEAFEAGKATICGVSFSLLPNTIVEGLPQPGDPVKVDFAVSATGFSATKVEVETEPEDCELRLADELQVRGDLAGGQPWRVSDIEFYVDGFTDLRDYPLAGEFVQVRAVPTSNGSFLATRIESDQAKTREDAENSDEEELSARLKVIDPDKARQGQTLSILIQAENSHFGPESVLSFQPAGGIQIKSVTFLSSTSLVANLSIDSNAALGDREAFVSTQDEIVSGERLRIEPAKTEKNEDSNSGSSSDSDEDESSDAELKDLQPDRGNRGQTLNVVIIGEDTQFSTSSVVNLGAGIKVNGVSLQSSTRLTANVTIASTAALGSRQVTVTTSGQVVGGEEFEVRSGSSGGEATGTPQESDNDDEDDEVDISGIVQSMSNQTWKVDGKTITINSQTEIEDTILVGDLVEVRAIRLSNGSLVAERIELDD